ncbi:hypothetical protein GSI_15076 [Ganoderma sinense ZZ0214-1]|uniref:Fungal-type protein kinase domain-containing protein n=1 Tax=Ganoderma sinense ZZ0214-1 TaxID=1077348 RepID=A0A2G8RM53_9APHY|nr:hypothetical protein GSI_15076 [Ganoderma sinense ZZ0214-1]
MTLVSITAPSSPTKALRQNSAATRKFTRQDARAELRSTMRRKATIVTLEEMMRDFLTPLAKGSKAIPNVFTKVPKFGSEKEMYEYITKTLNESDQFTRTGMMFVTTGYKPDKNDDSKQTIDCGMYASKLAPQEEYTESGEESRRMVWALIELLIECKLDGVGQDPFDDSTEGGEVTAEKRREVLGQILSYVELAFKYQQREAVFMVLFLGKYARVVRFDRSGIIASEKVDYKKDGEGLTEFLVRYARLGPAKRGHDTTAFRISPADPLWEKLKEHGAAAAEKDTEDHVQKLFNQSLDEKWPWWKLYVHDEESDKTKWFAVGKPHFYAGGVAGRGTRGYVAVPLDDDGEKIDSKATFVYLKDAWRVDHEGMEMEGTILKALNAAKVQYVPTLLYHGDLNQSTQSYDKWPDYHKDNTRETCPLKSHQHYRLVVAEVGKPLSEFENAFQLVWALFCCITAHEQACAAGYIHRDISAGNILLYKDENGEWSGLLNDWELSKECVDWELSKECVDWKTQGGGRQLDRTGTWQFMSVHALLKNTKLIEIPDDLESFFHVLVYFAVRFLPHNLADKLVGHFLYSYFDDYSDGEPGFICGPLKYNAIKRGVIDLTTITGSGGGDEAQTEQPLMFLEPYPAAAAPLDDMDTTENGKSVAAKTHPVNALVTDLLRAFQAFYARDAPEVPEQAAFDDPFGIAPGVLAKLKRRKAQKAALAGTSGAKPPSVMGYPTVDPEVAAKIESHAAILDVITDHLTGSTWPKLDKGEDKKPKGGYVPAKENTIVGSKRGAQDGGESTSKRVRSSAA